MLGVHPGEWTPTRGLSRGEAVSLLEAELSGNEVRLMQAAYFLHTGESTQSLARVEPHLAFAGQDGASATAEVAPFTRSRAGEHRDLVLGELLARFCFEPANLRCDSAGFLLDVGLNLAE